MSTQSNTYPFTNRKDAIAFIKSQGGPVETELLEHGRGKYEVIVTALSAATDPEHHAERYNPDVLSTSDAMDMSEVFEAEALGAEAVAELDAAVEANDEERERVLADLRVARDSGDRAERRNLIKKARALSIPGQEVADAAGVSITYVYDVANGNVRSTPALRERQKGYQEALADIAAIINTAPTIEVGHATVAQWITDNRLAAAADIFERAQRERTEA